VLYAAKKAEVKEKDKPRQVTEKECFEAVLLPPGVDPEKVTAVYRDGKLVVTLPLVPEVKGPPIPVQGG
jgi:HSP20 family molecular chaperone IbpA